MKEQGQVTSNSNMELHKEFSTFYLYSVELQAEISSTHHGNCL